MRNRLFLLSMAFVAVAACGTSAQAVSGDPDTQDAFAAAEAVIDAREAGSEPGTANLLGASDSNTRLKTALNTHRNIRDNTKAISGAAMKVRRNSHLNGKCF